MMATLRSVFTALAVLAAGLLPHFSPSAQAAVVSATYDSSTTVPLTAAGLTATGSTVNFTLNCQPATGARLMVVNNTSSGFIQGTFDNLANGAQVDLTFFGYAYHYVAWYYGGDGNDLVLIWRDSSLASCGADDSGQLGDSAEHPVSNGIPVSYVPVLVDKPGVLAGKTLVSLATGGLVFDGRPWTQSHSLALYSDGTLAAWGDGYGPTPVLVDRSGVLAGKTIISIGAGSGFSQALCSDGTVASWGNGATPAVVDLSSVIAGKTLVSLAVGDFLSVVLCSDGTLAAWGPLYESPVLMDRSGVLAGKTVVSLAAGSEHALALCSDGTLAALGYSDVGALGAGIIEDAMSAPVLVDRSGVLAGKTIVSIAAGNYHSLALCSDGTLAAWGGPRGGTSYQGQLGNGGGGFYFSGGSRVPVLVDRGGVLAGKTVVSIAAGGDHSLALCSDGTLTAWGSSFFDGAIGAGIAVDAYSPVPVIQSGVLAGKTIVSLAAGASHSLVNFAIDDSTYVAGALGSLTGTVNPQGLATKAYFEYGLTTSYGSSTSSTDLAVTNTVLPVTKAVSGLDPGNLYHYRLVTINSAGTTYGDDQTFTSLLPPPVVKLPTVTLNGPATVTVECRSAYTELGAFSGPSALSGSPWGSFSALRSDGSVIDINSPYPYAVVDSNAVAVVSDDRSGLALLSDGTVVAWDFYADIPAGLSNVVAISASMALRSDGTVVWWGYSGYAETTIPAGLSNVVAIDGGNMHHLALRSDGTVVGWGTNNYPPAGLSKVVAIAAGPNFSLALRRDGTVVGWGANGYGQTTIPAGLSNVVAIDAGRFFSLALRRDGTVVAWGYISSGLQAFVDGLRNVVSIAAGNTAITAVLSDGSVVTNRFTIPSDSDFYVAATVSGSVDTNTPGTYVLTYSATNIQGGTTTTTRSVQVLSPYTLTYTAGAHGSLTGTTPQTVYYNTSGTAVTAVPATGYHFVCWSDGSTANPRTDTNVTANKSVTATFALTTVSTWRETYFGPTATNAGTAADAADPYHTGVPNLLVYAFFGSDQDPATVQASQLPQATASGNFLSYEFTEPNGVSGLTYGAEWSATLGNDWQPVTDTGIAPVHNFRVPLDGPKKFLRLRVTTQ